MYERKEGFKSDSKAALESLEWLEGWGCCLVGLERLQEEQAGMGAFVVLNLQYQVGM